MGILYAGLAALVLIGSIVLVVRYFNDSLIGLVDRVPWLPGLMILAGWGVYVIVGFTYNFYGFLFSWAPIPVGVCFGLAAGIFDLVAFLKK